MASPYQEIQDSPIQNNVQPLDWSFLAYANQKKQSMYEQGAAKVQSMYSSVLNSPLSNPENQKTREQYLNEAKTQIQNLGKADLSLPQNIKSAQRIFSPFWEDNDVVSDVMTTKSNSASLQTLTNWKNSTDEKQRALYSDDAVNYINNSNQQLAEANRGDGSIQRVSSRTAVPAVDVTKILKDAAGTNGINITVTTQENGYKVERVNPDGTKELVNNWAKSILDNHPAFNDYAKMKGTVLYENRVNQLRTQGYDKQGAKDIISQDFIKNQADIYHQQYKQIDDQISGRDGINAQILGIQADLNKKYPNGVSGVSLNSYDLQQYNKLQTLQGQLHEYNNQRDDHYNNYLSLVNPMSPGYKSTYESLNNGAQDTYAQAWKLEAIQNGANALRIPNMSVKYDIDPKEKLLYDYSKFEQNLQKGYYGINAANIPGFPGNGTTQTGVPGQSTSMNLGNGPVKQEGTVVPKGPLPGGIDVKSQDIVGRYNRMVGAKENMAADYVKGGIGLLKDLRLEPNSPLKNIPDAFFDNLSQAITTGKYQQYIDKPIPQDPQGRTLEQVLDQMRDANIIPKSGSDFTKPSLLLKDLLNYGETYVGNSGEMSPNLVNQVRGIQSLSGEYNKIQKLFDQGDEEIKKGIENDPTDELRRLYKNGRVVSKEEYINDIKNSNAVKAQYIAPDGRLTTEMNPGFKRAYKEGEYENLYSKYQDKLSHAIGPLTEEGDKLQGQLIEYMHDPKNAQDPAGLIAHAAMYQSNLAEQGKDSPLTNSSSIERNIINIMQNNPAALARVQVDPIGLSGKPEVVLYPNMEELKKVLPEKVAEGVGNLMWFKEGANGEQGIRIIVSPVAQKDIPQLSSRNLYMGLFDKRKLDEYSSMQQPEILNKLGYNYTISKNQENGTYNVSMSYPIYNSQTGERTTYNQEAVQFPINMPVYELEDAITNKIQQQMQANKNYLTSPTGTPSNPVTIPADEWKATLNIK